MMTFIENDILNINFLRQYDIKIRIFLLPMYVFTAWRGARGDNLPPPHSKASRKIASPPDSYSVTKKADFWHAIF